MSAKEETDVSEDAGTLEVTDLGGIPAQVTVTESPTVAVARERLVEAIGREAAFLADQRAGQASAGLESLARAFALVASPATALAASPASPHLAISGRALADPVAFAKDFVAGNTSAAISKTAKPPTEG
ncbi:hypothetical protein OG432_11035 [Streptomyces sp. NBC_00442]|uniref:hypothetical protein n=1 Tax=Streptomyces sp. NBC_00442 TaxID=2903651 RepID=UPI002E1EC8E8